MRTEPVIELCVLPPGSSITPMGHSWTIRFKQLYLALDDHLLRISVFARAVQRAGNDADLVPAEGTILEPLEP